MSMRAPFNNIPSGASSQATPEPNEVIRSHATKHALTPEENVVKRIKLNASDYFYRSDSATDEEARGGLLVPTEREKARVERRLAQTRAVNDINQALHLDQVETEVEGEDEGEINSSESNSPEPSSAGPGLAKSAIATGEFFTTSGGDDDDDDEESDDDYIENRIIEEEDTEDTEDTNEDVKVEEIGGENSTDNSQENDDFYSEGGSLYGVVGHNAHKRLEAYKKIASGTVEIKDDSSQHSIPPSSPLSSLSGLEDERPVGLEEEPEEAWRFEQIYLNQILKARDEYSLMPTTWRMHFRGVPLPDGLFYVQTQKRSLRPRIYAHSERFEYRGAKTLSRFMQLHERIRENRRLQAANPTQELGYSYTVPGRIRKELTDALHWAELDADIARYAGILPPNIKIMEMEDLDRLDMDTHIQQGMLDLAEKWQEIVGAVPKRERPATPILFAFVIYKHILSIVTFDGDNPDAVCHIPIQLSLSEKNQSQWNALAIMVTICWARDLFSASVKEMGDLVDMSNVKLPYSNADVEESDPDA